MKKTIRNRIWQIQDTTTGLWWAGSRGWSKTPKVYKKLGHVRSALSYHKDCWKKMSHPEFPIKIQIVEFEIKEVMRHPIDLEENDG